MSLYATPEYNICKTWVAEKIQEGFTWDNLLTLCVPSQQAEDEFARLQYEELVIPFVMCFDEWPNFITTLRENYSPIIEMFGIASDNTSDLLPVPADPGSAWVRYKNNLLGIPNGKAKMSEAAVALVEKNCHWILNHLRRDTRESGEVKGLVMGSVQSGKTANMIGLISMAAHYDWNFVIILSGTIDNLRKQTRDRIFGDLTKSGGVSWHVLEQTSNADYFMDFATRERYLTDDLSLNIFQNGRSNNNWLHRYVTVCLKNSTRLRNLIRWLHKNSHKAARMRILVIDDEADQASVNTRKMHDESEEEYIERTAVNQLIINLVNGKDENGIRSTVCFQAMNYISFTATPYANVLNEAYKASLYPHSFICSLPESKEYFGSKVIFGSKEDEQYPGLDIIRIIPAEEIKALKKLHGGEAIILPCELQKAIAWFICSAAALRVRGHKKPISMLIHTTAIQAGHFEEYEILKQWFNRGRTSGEIIALCESVYESEKEKFTLKDLAEGFPDYGKLNQVNAVFPEFDQIKPEIRNLLSEIENILLGEEKQFIYRDDGIHLCVDNCSANRMAENGTYLRIVYPNAQQLNEMKKAPVFIVMGGNTLSRGLTLEGLVCTYFARNSNQADSLMQMARWFGYRAGYELFQRIWMPVDVQNKFEVLQEIDEKLKTEFEEFMERGLSPSQFGPRVMSSAKIARFMLSSKNKVQGAAECDFDFTGDSYETTDFINDKDKLERNIVKTELFLRQLGQATVSQVAASAFVWRGISVETILDCFLENDNYKIFESSALHKHLPVFIKWMREMNRQGNYLKWNVAIAGDSVASERWIIANASVGKISRSKRKNVPSEKYIDIGSLRSGKDVLCDVQINELNEEQTHIFNASMRNRKNLIYARGLLGLSDVPLLLLYRIDKNKGKTSENRLKLDADEDIIGVSIIVPGESVGSTHARSLRVRIPD